MYAIQNDLNNYVRRILENSDFDVNRKYYGKPIYIFAVERSEELASIMYNTRKDRFGVYRANSDGVSFYSTVKDRCYNITIPEPGSNHEVVRQSNPDLELIKSRVYTRFIARINYNNTRIKNKLSKSNKNDPTRLL